jgi:hypothetical protein
MLAVAGCQHNPVVAASGPLANQVDAPGRVARLSYARGAVSFQAAGTNEREKAALNRPFTSGDRVWTDEGARAELHAGSVAVRLGERTSVEFVALDDRTLQLKMTAGTMEMRVWRLEDQETAGIDTPRAAVSLPRAGDYRIDVSETTRVIARAGQADVSADNQTFMVRAGQSAAISTGYQITAAPQPDAFDEFCAQRNQREERAGARKYVSPTVIGWEDLDEYGVWQSHPGYGWIWAPRAIAPGWAPYRFGHWVWIEPWGWTWIDDAPWGFAPFHYGRWVYWELRWWWTPGPVHIRAVYAPALVVFVGGGRPGFRIHWGLSVGIGVAWFPLGPHEVYVPPYRGSRTYITNVNVSNTVIHDSTTIHRTNPERQRYANRTVEGAVTAVREDAFKSGQPVGRSAEPVGRRQAESSKAGGMGLPERPAPRSADAKPPAQQRRVEQEHRRAQPQPQRRDRKSGRRE